MTVYTPKQAKKILMDLTNDTFSDLINELRGYLDCAPDQGVVKAVGSYKDKVRALRNSQTINSGRWIPNVAKDNNDDAEDIKIHKDFLFIQEYLRGPRPINLHSGALAAANNPDKANRPAIFSVNDKWHSGLVLHLCDNAYNIPTLGHQLKIMADFYDIITETDDDSLVINKFSDALGRINKDSALNKHTSADDRLSDFCRKVFDIISCVVFPIAGVRALQSYMTRGTWNFFKPDGKAFVDCAKDVVGRTEHYQYSP